MPWVFNILILQQKIQIIMISKCLTLKYFDFFQVFNILADYHGKAVCVFNVVMTCRKFELYKRVLERIRDRFPSFKPQQLMADYESAMRRGFKNIGGFFTRLIFLTKGCFYFFSLENQGNQNNSPAGNGFHTLKRAAS